MTENKTEEALLAMLEDPNQNQQSARWELVQLYRSAGRIVDAMYHAEEYLAGARNSDEKAGMYFYLGQAMEHVKDWESAFRFYTKALEQEPGDKLIWYFIHNNIGFSLNQLERYSDAEKYLLDAIAIDAGRANAFKNLGLSLEGQRRFVEAAQSFIAAVEANAADPRALRHLEELSRRHKEVYLDMADLDEQITKCREVVEYAAKQRTKRS